MASTDMGERPRAAGRGRGYATAAPSLGAGAAVAAVAAMATAVLAAACQPNGTSAATGRTAGTPANAAGASAGSGAAAAAPTRPRVVFIGTSLTAGLGLDPDSAYPALVERKADSAGTPITAVNAGVSGETSAGALRRVDWVLADPADVIVVETGANDGLRGQSPDALRRNLEQIVGRARALHPRAKVAVVQMEAPPNFGQGYTRRFHDVYPAVARGTGAALFPFLLEGVAGEGRLNQPDGIHPNEEGARRVATTVWRALQPLVATTGAAPLAASAAAGSP
jgi:acyl-CoA thioesterase-1